MALFGGAISKLWAAASETAKLSAAAVAVGAEGVGRAGTLAAEMEAAVEAAAAKAGGALDAASVAVSSAVKTTAAEWKGYMDVKLAQAKSALGLSSDVAAARAKARQQVAQVAQAAQQQYQAIDRRLESELAQVKAAQAQRAKAALLLAQRMKSAAAAAGQKAAAAIDGVGGTLKRAGDAVDSALIKGGMRAAGAVLGVAGKALGAVKDAAAAGYGKIAGLFGAQPAEQVCKVCLDKTPAGQARAALKKWDQQLKAGAPGLTEAQKKELAKTAEATKMALLANAAYSGGAGVLPDDYELVRPEELKLAPESFAPSDSGFRAVLFRRKGTEPAQYVLAFKGTTMTSEEDWENNLLQGTGLDSDYYERAMDLARRVKRSSGGNVSMTGHSLGGGLASAAAMSVGVPATTFNASGLSESTVPFDAGRAGQISAYHVRGEVLTALQSGLGTVGLMPEAVGAPTTLHTDLSYSPVGRHGMDCVLDGLLGAGNHAAQPAGRGSP